MPDGRYEHVINGQVIAVTKVFYDPAKHEACALLTKDKGQRRFRHVELPRADPLQFGGDMRFRLVQLPP